MGNIRNFLFLHSIYSFVSGILYIILPLMMVERKINIITIGFIFGILPFTFQILRILFATLSDHFGRRKFLLLHGIATAVSSIVYYFAFTPLQFLAGKLTEVVKDASIWSINRPIMMDHSKDKRYGLILMRVYDNIFSAVGILISGLLLSYLFFSNSILAVFIMGLLIIPIPIFIKSPKNNGGSFKKAFSSLNFLKKTSSFKKFMIFYLIMGLADGFATSYIFPLFLSQKGFTPDLIGFILGIQCIIAGFSTFVFRKISIRKSLILSLSYPVLLFILPFSSGVFISIFIFLIGITFGLIISSSEGVVSLVSNKNRYGSDTGIIFLGYNLGRTINLSISGLIISSYGFITLFPISSLLFILCVFYGARNIKE
ncbi:MAG: MFS transporter [Candidatus Aenigmatarchaeota archaeon]